RLVAVARPGERPGERVLVRERRVERELLPRDGDGAFGFSAVVGEEEGERAPVRGAEPLGGRRGLDRLEPGRLGLLRAPQRRARAGGARRAGGPGARRGGVGAGGGGAPGRGACAGAGRGAGGGGPLGGDPEPRHPRGGELVGLAPPRGLPPPLLEVAELGRR